MQVLGTETGSPVVAAFPGVVQGGGSMNVLIDEISRFIKEGWPGKDWYMDDCGPAFEELFKEDGETPISPGTLVKLEDFECAVLWQGAGDDPSPGRMGYSFTTLFKKWKKALTTVFMAVEAPKDKADAVKAAIKKAGGRVVT
jgi:hypothetical protein